MRSFVLMLVLSVLAIHARAEAPEAPPPPAASEKLGPAVPPNTIWITGTVKYLPMEGGFFGIVGDDGKRYDPISLSPAFARDGARVKLQARTLGAALTIRMWGTPIRIVDIEAAPVDGATESDDE